ncbi:MAG: ketol-acid reductoisomerase [Chloroflexota bacterium]
MEHKVYRDEDVTLDALQDKVIAVLGYGIQGGPQALCLRDSGLNVIVGAGPKDRFPDWEKAEADGFEVMSIDEATRRGDVIHYLLPDPAQPAVYYQSIHNNLKPDSTLSFAHGFNVLYGAIVPPDNVNVVLFVPNSPGHMVREKFLAGSGIYGAIAVDQDVTGEAKDIVLGLAKGVGSTRVGVVELDFQQETEGDNFEEQVLYGGTIHLMKAVFNTMVDNGYSPYFAYAKAIRSLRTVIDVMDEIGIEAYISSRSSRTAEFAVRMSGPRVIDYDEIQKVFEETERGEFAARWMQEWQLGMPRLHRMRRTGANSTMEEIGKAWRKQFGEG